jgi:lysozyme family protein
VIDENAIEKTIDKILAREGGFVNDPADRGGATNYGITAGTLGDWRNLKRHATSEEVQALSMAEARAIYRANYVEPFLFVGDPELLDVVVDCAVNSGPPQAVKFLQRALGVVADGIVGDITRNAVGASVVPKLKLRFVAARVKFLGEFVANNPSQLRFIRGWLNRAVEPLEA